MTPVVGQVALGLYAFLLAVGGITGYMKAASTVSLISGIGCAILAVLCLVLSASKPVLGLGLGTVLAAFLFVLFGVRFADRRKFMPAGLLTIVSLIVVVLLIGGSFQAQS